MDRLRLPAWVKDRAEEIQNSPPLTICVVFFFIYAVEKIWPGTFYAILSASLGAGVLYIFQMREDLWPASLQRLFGIEVASDSDIGTDGLDDENNNQIDEDVSLLAEDPEEGAEECFMTVGGDDWFSGGVDSNGLVGHGAEAMGDSSCQDGFNSNETQHVTSEWFEMLNQDWSNTNAGRNDRGVMRGTEITVPEEEPPDPVNKARLDLLFRYLASMDARNGEQGATPQRQKLQRKLLQRTAAGEHFGTMKSGKKAAIAAGDLPDAAQNKENVLEDSTNIEALLRELGEPKRASSQAKAQGPSKRARRKGSGLTSGPTKRTPPPVQENVEPEAHEAKKATAKKSERSQEVPSFVAAVESRSDEQESHRSADSDAAQEDVNPTCAGEEVDESEPIGFQVVENKKDKKERRKSRKEDRLKADAEAQAEAAAKQAEAKAKADAEAAVKKAAAEAKAKAKLDEELAAKKASAMKDAHKTSEQARWGQSTTQDAEDATDAAKDAQVVPSPCEAEKGGQDEETVEEEGEWEDDDEAWEWQCPEGYLLQPYTCPRPLLCSSCGKTVPEEATVLRAEESGWLACEECIQIACQLPVEPLARNQELEVESADPYTMSALEIANWFKDRGAENELRRCMVEVLESRSTRLEADKQPQQSDGKQQQCEESMTTSAQK